MHVDIHPTLVPKISLCVEVHHIIMYYIGVIHNLGIPIYEAASSKQTYSIRHRQMTVDNEHARS